MDIKVSNVVPADQPWFMERGAVEAESFTYLRPDAAKIQQVFTTATSAAANFAVKAVDSSGKIVGALGALTVENLWAEKKCSIVVFFVSDKPPAGVMLVRRYRDWLDSRPGVRVGGFAPSFDMSPRTTLLLEAMGFNRQGGQYLRCKG